MATGKKRGRLTRSADFDRVYQDGSSRANRHIVVYAFPRQESQGGVRLGLSVNRKVGSAVARNKTKRMLREAFWEVEPALGDSRDFVVVARPQIAALIEEEDGYDRLKQTLAEVLDKFKDDRDKQ